jgi:hypothetical protein
MFTKYEPFVLERDPDCAPDEPSFRTRVVHFMVMTRNGRPVYSRFGNLIKLSTFTATLVTVLNKWRVFDEDKKPRYPHRIALQNSELLVQERGELLLVALANRQHGAPPSEVI